MRLISSILALITATAVSATPLHSRSIKIGSSSTSDSDGNFTDITAHVRAAQAGIDGDAINRLRSLNIQAPGVNAYGPDRGRVWIGGGGFWTNKISNANSNRVILVLWDGKDKSFVNDHLPAITVSLGPNESVDISFADGVSGAWSAVYDNTPRGTWGQVSNTWGEYTTDGVRSTFDISKAVRMSGNGMIISGGGCVSSTYTNQCVFVCPNGEDTCQYGVKLLNCETGSQPGAGRGTDPGNGADSGGCHVGGPIGNMNTFLMN